jgi:hypothetical protein
MMSYGPFVAVTTRTEDNHQMGKEEAPSPSPKEHFNRLPDAERERLVAAIEQTPPELFVRPFAAAVAQRAKVEDSAWVESLCLYLADWFAFLSENPDAYLERIVEALTQIPEGEDRTPQEVDTLRGQWRRVMQADATIGVTLKAFDILNRQANAYQKARTTTEIRPVYRTDPQRAPEHAILLHQLHVTYHTEYGTQTVHVAMDALSIASLIEVLQRALAKEVSLLDQEAYHYLGKVPDAK